MDNTKPVKIRVAKVGQNFGVCGQIRHAANGRLIHETDVTASREGAAEMAAAWARKHGYSVSHTAPAPK